MTDVKAADIIIFGGTGDLSMRMLMPSLYYLRREGHLPADTRIFGASRSALSREDYQAKVAAALREFLPKADQDDRDLAAFHAGLDYVPVDAAKPESFADLKAALGDGERRRLFYLSTPPSLYGAIADGLQETGLADPNAHIALEKPIGHDLQSAKMVNDRVAATFPEDRIFRIDHYLGKATVQNLLALRFGNSIFEPIWNNRGIDHVEITVAETLGVEGRREFYDEVGALRDMVQNHMLQLLALIAMEPPVSLDGKAVQDEKLKVLRALRPIDPDAAAERTISGQYVAGAIAGRHVPGYSEGGENCDTATFVAIEAYVDSWRWAGVPFYLRTGKRLPSRFTEIVIQFKDIPHSIFAANAGAGLEANKLVIRLQPEENIALQLMNSLVGVGLGDMNLQPVSLNLSLSEQARNERRRIAYERLLLDALHGNGTLFVGRGEVEAAWTWIDGIAEGWKQRRIAPALYRAGSWGPESAQTLLRRAGRDWHDAELQS